MVAVWLCGYVTVYCVVGLFVNVCSHDTRNDLVLFSGRKKIREIATAYGFNHFLTVSDLHRTHPTAYPDVAPEKDDAHRHLHDHDRIAAVCVLMDPFSWEKELQVDVVLTHSLTYSRTHVLTYSRTHVLTYSRTHVLTYSRTHSFIGSFS